MKHTTINGVILMCFNAFFILVIIEFCEGGDINWRKCYFHYNLQTILTCIATIFLNWNRQVITWWFWTAYSVIWFSLMWRFTKQFSVAYFWHPRPIYCYSQCMWMLHAWSGLITSQTILNHRSKRTILHQIDIHSRNLSV